MGAKECFENQSKIKDSTRCGTHYGELNGGGSSARRTILVEYAHDANTPKDESNLVFYLYPVNAQLEGDPPVKVRASFSGYMDGSRDYSVPYKGLKITLPEEAYPQKDGDLNIVFKTLGSVYQIYPKHERQTIQVKDNDPLKFYYYTNTLHYLLDEGQFSKLAQFSFIQEGAGQDLYNNVSRRQRDFTVDFNISGCALQNTEITGTHSNEIAKGPGHATSVPVGQDIPCWINIVGSGVTRLGPDSFRVNRSGGIGFQIAMKVGQDDDLLDETITWNPVVDIGSSGGTHYVTNFDGKNRLLLSFMMMIPK